MPKPYKLHNVFQFLGFSRLNNFIADSSEILFKSWINISLGIHSSSNDSGCVIYLRESPITIEDTSFQNCYTTFGAGLTSLNSDVNAKNVRGYNNVTKYNGGVIYHIYGIFNGRFIIQ